MRPSAAVFLAVLAAAIVAWVLTVLPVTGRAADLASRLAREDIAARASAADPSPTPEEARRLGELLAALRTPAPIPVPQGLAEDSPGSFAGRLPWEEVQGLLAWAAEQPRTVLEIEVRALAEDPSRAACRVVLGQ